MKFTKFIPVALMLALAVPAVYADPEPDPEVAQSDMTITVPEFINITKLDGAIETATASYDATYDNITLNNAMTATFRVVTNKPGDTVYLWAQANEGSAVLKTALGGTDEEHLKMVFTREGTGEAGANSGAILNALQTTPTKVGNKNAIAFSVTPSITADDASGAVTPGASLADNVVTYTMSKAGKCDFQYTLGTTQVANTFSTHDQAGTYKSTLFMTHAAP
jgi:hypothetical protein